MSIFITGATGYLGSYITDLLLRHHRDDLALLIRARDRGDALEKLWRSLQLHLSAAEFAAALPRLTIVRGDLTAPELGIDAEQRRHLLATVDSVIHTAATLNRKSAKACLNTNLRGTLSVIKLVRAIADDHELRRFSFVSTTGVAGTRQGEDVSEDEAIDWARSDYDPYGRTKKFAEHLVHELLPDLSCLIFRPSTVMGDSRFVETTQFDMVRAFCALVDLPAVPIRPEARLDIVNADFVAAALVALHQSDSPRHDTYHLSAGVASRQAQEIVAALVAKSTARPPRFYPKLLGPFSSAVDLLASSRRRNALTRLGSLLKVFLPYITYDTVFDNLRVTSELGLSPVPFTDYCADLYRYAKAARFEYPYAPLPRGIIAAER